MGVYYDLGRLVSGYGMMRLIPPILLFFLFSPAHAQRLGDFPPDVQAVFRYLLANDVPEQYGNIKVKLRPRGYEIVDIDQDGTREVFFWSAPHYHQTAPVLIYQVFDDGSVKRVKEGLAPGPLVDLTGELGDSHRTGYAADEQIPNASPGDLSLMVKSFVRFRMQVVEYSHFYHTARAGDAGGYLDMTHQKRFTEEDRNSCLEFQLSRTMAIGSGRIGDSEYPFFVALAGDTIDIYRIKGIDRFGFLDKTIWRIDKPDDFNGFVKGVDQTIRYWNENNEQKLLEVDFDAMLPISGDLDLY